MKKILVVAKNEIIRESLRLVCAGMKLNVILTDHADALTVFLTEEPAAVIVCDYAEKGGEEGLQTFKDVKSSTTKEVVLRLGFSKLDYSDYLQMPLNLKELKKKLNKKGGK